MIRRYSAHIVEVNPTFSIVEMVGMSDDITSLYQELKQLNCVLQFVRSGRIAVSTSCFERVNEYLAHREERYQYGTVDHGRIGQPFAELRWVSCSRQRIWYCHAE